MPSKFSGKQKLLVPLRREPNGRRQRLAKPAREADIRAVVLGQPHRKGDDPKRPDTLRATPIGRLIVDRQVRVQGLSTDSLAKVVGRYNDARRNMQRVDDAKRPFAVAGGGAEPEDLAPEKKRRYKADWEALEAVLLDCGAMVHRAIVFALEDASPCADERAFPVWVLRSLPVGLAALARHFGFLGK